MSELRFIAKPLPHGRGGGEADGEGERVEKTDKSQKKAKNCIKGSLV